MISTLPYKTLNFSFKSLWRKQSPSREREINGLWTRMDGWKFVAEVMLCVTCVAVEMWGGGGGWTGALNVCLQQQFDCTHPQPTERPYDRVDLKQTNKQEKKKNRRVPKLGSAAFSLHFKKKKGSSSSSCCKYDISVCFVFPVLLQICKILRKNFVTFCKMGATRPPETLLLFSFFFFSFKNLFSVPLSSFFFFLGWWTF